MGKGPLDGVLVVALEQAVAAPLATCRMADAGARVIKIERAEGDFARDYDRAAGEVSSYFAWLNRGKESLVLDVKAAEDMALLERLLAKADVFVQNLAPGAVDRLGVGATQLAERFPQLITVDISAYGPVGPFRDRKGYDLLIQAESGLASVTGAPEQPGRIGVSVCDIATGMNAYAAVLEALLARQTTGRGAHLHVALFDVAAEWMAVPLIQYEASGVVPPRAGLHHVSIAPYGAYGCQDGEVLLSIQNEREWVNFCAQVLRRPQVATDARFATNSVRVANRPALNAILAEVFEALPRAVVIDRLNAASIAYGAINTTADLAGHPHLRRIVVETPGGRIDAPAPPVLGAAALPTPARVPAIGADSQAIRAEFAPDLG
ncbi:CaiB/BaiF CoA-transferase family protein [Phenylobacterium aquaticum]|uniref:CaiB/BaiF CoA transferase family protein n=1 Tax=Phenylobacterium aquaticum TaxID=1763816 RepID=UPI0026F30742|nr:CaiB/BaiF CoA-transferase family protein [Phenylobacterium aquaticum]